MRRKSCLFAAKYAENKHCKLVTRIANPYYKLRRIVKSAATGEENRNRAHESSGIDQAMAKINAAWQAASQDMYQAQQQAGPQGGAAGFDPNNMGENPGGAQQTNNGSNNDTVEDADYEEVK